LKADGYFDDRNGWRQPGLVGHILWSLNEVDFDHEMSAKDLEDAAAVCDL